VRVLVVKTSSMGDVIHTLPALTDAARALPDTSFDWVVEEGFREIPAWHPAVDRVIPVALRRWRRNPLKTLLGGEWRAYRATLRERDYDAVIDAQGLLKSALLATRMARGPCWGLDAASAREPLASRFYDHPVAVARGQHAVERVRQLFAAALGYALPSEPGDAGLTGRFGAVPREAYLVFLHGTTRADKHWPEAHWIGLARKAGEAGFGVRLLWSNAAERARAERIAAAARHAVVEPRMTLGEIAALLSRAAGIVSVDTGLSHLAAALGRPNVTLFGSTDPGLVGGYGANQKALRARDFGHPAPGLEPAATAALTPDIVWPVLADLMRTAKAR